MSTVFFATCIHLCIADNRKKKKMCSNKQSTYYIDRSIKLVLVTDEYFPAVFVHIDCAMWLLLIINPSHYTVSHKTISPTPQAQEREKKTVNSLPPISLKSYG